MRPSILFTVDVEDWFQVENFKSSIAYDSWDRQEFRVANTVCRLLDLLDECADGKKGTFFVLGWIAKKSPDMVREIYRRGHEVASHGMRHILYNIGLPSRALITDLKDSKELLEDIVGAEVHGFRAPSFSVTNDVLDMIKSCGYLYDSSHNSFDRHGRYGKLILRSQSPDGLGLKLDSRFYEIPISNFKMGGQVVPAGGGGYFRFFPFFMFHFFVRRIIREQGVYMFYMHPWEIDPNQPKVRKAKWSSKFRHYVNLKNNHKKLRKFLSATRRARYLTCIEYVEQHLKAGTAA